MSLEERTKVAQELAVKGGNDWEKLSPEMVNAYLHNADLVIEERGRAPIDELNPKPLYTCDRCQDTAYIGEERCFECNPMGLLAVEVHPQIETRPDDSVEGEKVGGFMGDDLTEEEIGSIRRTFATPPEALTEETLQKATDAVEAEKVKKTRPLKPSEYRCSKCSKPGKTVIHMLKKGGKGIGHKHQEFKVEHLR